MVENEGSIDLYSKRSTSFDKRTFQLPRVLKLLLCPGLWPVWLFVRVGLYEFLGFAIWVDKAFPKVPKLKVVWIALSRWVRLLVRDEWGFFVDVRDCSLFLKSLLFLCVLTLREVNSRLYDSMAVVFGRFRTLLLSKFEWFLFYLKLTYSSWDCNWSDCSGLV